MSLLKSGSSRDLDKMTEQKSGRPSEAPTSVRVTNSNYDFTDPSRSALQGSLTTSQHMS